jgi:hypothetical protein
MIIANLDQAPPPHKHKTNKQKNLHFGKSKKISNTVIVLKNNENLKYEI